MSSDRGMSTRESIFWQHKAACADEDYDLFNSREHGERAEAFRDRFAEAKQICASCPVQAECAKDAEGNEGAGIRAGMYWAGGRVVDAPTRAVVQFCTACNGPLSISAIQAHRKTCNSACTRERQQHVEYQSQHGTVGGYQRHKRHGETPCPSCRAASNHASERRKKRRAEDKSAARLDLIRTWGRERGLVVHPVGPPSDGLIAAYAAYEESPGTFEAAS